MKYSDSQNIVVNDLQPFKDYNKFCEGSPYLKSCVKFKFDIDESTSSVNIDYDIIDNTDNYETGRYSVSENCKDYCFAALMFDKLNGNFYLGSSSNEVNAPLLDARRLFNNIIKVELGREIDIPVNALDNLFQNMKLQGRINRGAKLEDLLSEVVDNYSGSSQKTSIGKLLYGATNVIKSNLTIDDFRKVFSTLNIVTINFVKYFTTAINSINTNKSLGLLRTIGYVCDSIKDVVNSKDYDMLVQAPNPKADFTREFASNPIFNPTVRRFVVDLIDLGNHSHWTKDKSKEKNADTVITVINSTDIINDPILDLYVNSMDSGVIPNIDRGYGVTDDFSVNDTKLLRVRQITNLTKLSDQDELARDELVNNLNQMRDNNTELVDPNSFIMPARVLALVNSLLTMIVNDSSRRR